MRVSATRTVHQENTVRLPFLHNLGFWARRNLERLQIAGYDYPPSLERQLPERRRGRLRPHNHVASVYPEPAAFRPENDRSALKGRGQTGLIAFHEDEAVCRKREPHRTGPQAQCTVLLGLDAVTLVDSRPLGSRSRPEVPARGLGHDTERRGLSRQRNTCEQTSNRSRQNATA